MTVRRIDDFDIVAFDADDTLWKSEDGFRAAETRFAELVSPFAPVGVDVLDALHATEKSDIASQGYGVKAGTPSMFRTTSPGNSNASTTTPRTW